MCIRDRLVEGAEVVELHSGELAGCSLLAGVEQRARIGADLDQLEPLRDVAGGWRQRTVSGVQCEQPGCDLRRQRPSSLELTEAGRPCLGNVRDRLDWCRRLMHCSGLAGERGGILVCDSSFGSGGLRLYGVDVTGTGSGQVVEIDRYCPRRCTPDRSLRPRIWLVIGRHRPGLGFSQTEPAQQRRVVDDHMRKALPRLDQRAVRGTYRLRDRIWPEGEFPGISFRSSTAHRSQSVLWTLLNGLPHDGSWPRSLLAVLLTRERGV